MDVQPTQPSAKGPAEWFTGDVWIDAIARGAEPCRIRVSAVHFTPGARTAWHSHALGQTLYVTEGVGRVQSRGGDIVDIRPGDVISTPPHEWHWHGASADHFMTHISMTEAVGEGQGPETEWGAHVTDAEYRQQREARPRPTGTAG
jgi:quercetin dioxygenase-like cupin family protein